MITLINYNDVFKNSSQFFMRRAAFISMVVCPRKKYFPWYYGRGIIGAMHVNGSGGTVT